MLDALLTITSVIIGLYVGFRMFRRSLRSMWKRVGPFILSSREAWYASDNSVAPLVAQPIERPATVIATPSNERNDELQRNAVTEAVTPEAARDIIRHQAKAEAVAKLIKAGKLTNRAEAIELVFGVRRNNREGSDYMEAKAAVEALLPSGPVVMTADGTKEPMNYPVTSSQPRAVAVE